MIKKICPICETVKNSHLVYNDEHVYVIGKDKLFKIFSKNNFKNIKIENLKN